MVGALFFTWSFATALLTLNALRKPVPPGRGLAPIWLLGMIVSEMAPWLLMVGALIALGFLALGGDHGAFGPAGMALFALSELGLLLVVRRTLTSVTRIGRGASLMDLFRVWDRLPESTEAIREVAYADDLTLDVYRPTNMPTGPALIYLHPGSWTRGRPGRQARPMVHRLIELGWVVLDARYPLSPAATFPDHVIGVKRAIAWAKTEGSAFGIDPGMVAISGGSSGGHLAALAALTWDDSRLQPGFESADTSVMACVPFYGIFDLLVRNPTRHDWPFIARHVLKAKSEEDPMLYRDASPVDQVRGDAPPFLVVHGDFDSVVLCEESRIFVEALRAAGATVDYREIYGAQHGFDAVRSLRSRAVGAMAANWLNQVARDRQAMSPGADVYD